MGNPAKSSPATPAAVEAAAPEFMATSKRNHKRTALVHVAVALGAIAVYQSICTLIWPVFNQFVTSPPTIRLASLNKRDVLEDRATGGTFWDEIKPSKELQWHKCNKKFQCARLEVPLDYWNGTEGTAILAIAQVPARVPVTDPRYGGPILMNPGGPGVSATSQIFQVGTSLQRMFDSLGKPSLTENNTDARYYDFLGIDPRGVGQTLPSASCFETDMQKAEWNLRMAAAGIMGSSDVSVAEDWGRRRAYGLGCYHLAQSRNITDNAFPFMSSASTARDMVTFIDRYAEWREGEAKRLLKRKAIPESLQYQKGRERVNYYGLSGGTMLGMTFASMFPNRTGRFVMDAVVLMEDYIHALWTISVRDSEKAVDWFYDSCAKAGPKKCALAKTGSSAHDVRTRANSILDHLYRHPVASTGKLPDLLTWSDVRTIQQADIYQPLLWAQLAKTLVALEDKITSPLAAASSATNYPTCGKLPEDYLNFDAESGIMCGDAYPDDRDWTLQDVQKHWEHLSSISPTLAPTFVPLRATCAAWRQSAKYAYRGPFESSPDSGVPPMLFISNKVDPVTPLYAGQQMVKRFSGSRLLTLDMPGHSSMALPSACKIRHARTYMQTGKLPEEGAVCQPDHEPFGVQVEELVSRGVNALDDPSLSFEAEDEALIAAHMEASRTFLNRKRGVGRGVLAP